MTAIRKRTWTDTSSEQHTAWLVDYRDNAGKRRGKQFARKKDAEAWLTQAAWHVSQGTHTADSQSITVAKAAEQWIERGRRDGLEPTTIAAYDQHARLHLVPLCGSKRLSQLTTPMVEGYRDQLVDKLSRPMAIRVLRSLSSIISEAQRRGQVAQNVARNVKVKRAARQRAKAVIPSKASLRALLRAAEGAGDAQGQALVMLALFGGLRASELRGLAWSGLDLKGASVTISQRADAKGKIGAPKSASSRRTVPLPPSALTALKTWKLACRATELDLVFPSVGGKVMSHRYMSLNVLQPLLGAAKVAPLGLHDLRHAAASLWIEQRVDAKRVQTWLGHHSIQVTFDTYGHLFEAVERDSSVAAAIEKALIG
ncbi:site-specific integrase [Sphingomonas sp. BN140010]|uniref:Site-specific integrase n=1 Tax=Sphingomonas arvum TaxID=2992113 RepID=A0ABT3JBT6_9SPHN|nr:site-specific integrase [Sphingomonas sp. BN140010]MCW3796486.1 site-specific integrase [Sphingomonas sp. BN140010]